MEMTERIQFCKDCTKRKFDNQTGIICSLTNKKPEFQHKCGEFEEDTDNIQKHKERLSYNPRKWKRSDNKFSESTNSIMKFDLFEIDSRIQNVVFRKHRFNKISITCLAGYVFTMYYILSGDSDFYENIKDPLNQFIWALMLIYPVIRYFQSFKKYKLDSNGIKINETTKIRWSDIRTVRNYVTIDNEDDTITTLYLYLVLNNYKNIRLSLDNYTVDNFKNIKSILKQKGIKLDEKEMIESIILSFHKHYGQNSESDCDKFFNT